MKKRYTFSSDDSFEADLDDLKRLLTENQQYVENYEDVLSSLYDDDYVARGNGFCDRKYSDDFVESQLEKYQKRVEELENWIKEGFPLKLSRLVIENQRNFFHCN